MAAMFQVLSCSGCQGRAGIPACSIFREADNFALFETLKIASGNLL